MKVIITEDYGKLSNEAARIIAEEINANPSTVLGLATGSSPIGTYKRLVEQYQAGAVDFLNVTTFNLDEYCGLSADNNQSYHYFMHQNLFDHINIKRENIHIPDGLTSNVKEYVQEYDEMIEKAGGIDLQLLGIGKNGHIAFNEPDTELHLGTHLTDLSDSTIKANSRFFDSVAQVPTQAITVGIGTIMKAKKILLLANGEGKAGIIAQLLTSKTISTRIPASILLLHDNFTIIVDKEAAQAYKKFRK